MLYSEHYADIEIYALERGEKGLVMVGRDGLAWTATFGAMGRPLKEFLAGCDEEYIARKFETPQHETDWEATKVAVADSTEGYLDDLDVATAFHYEGALRETFGDDWPHLLPERETPRFRSAREAARTLIRWASEYDSSTLYSSPITEYARADERARFDGVMNAANLVVASASVGNQVACLVPETAIEALAEAIAALGGGS